MEVVPLTAPYIAYTVDTVYTVYTIQNASHHLNSMYACMYC